jgi:hypothetical protein
MKTRRRRILLLIGLFTLALNPSCLSVHFKVHGRAERADGRPVTDVIVFYSYRGEAWNPVCSSSYTRPGSVARSGAAGAYEIPGAIHFHKPYPLQGGTRVEALVYSPETHALLRVQGKGQLERPVLDDHGEDPEKWHTAAREALQACFDAAPREGGAPAKFDLAPEARRELHAALRREWRLFREKFGDRPFRPGDPRRWGSFADDAIRALDDLDGRIGAVAGAR